MSTWEDYNIDGVSFKNKLVYPSLKAFTKALQEKFLAIPLSTNITPKTWRLQFQTELNKILPYYVPYYEDTEKAQEWKDFLDTYGFLAGKTDSQIETFLENLCNTGNLNVTPPAIFLADYAKMVYDLLNLMTSIRADKKSYIINPYYYPQEVSSIFKINYTEAGTYTRYDTENNYEQESWVDNVQNQTFNKDYFYAFGSGSYRMQIYPYDPPLVNPHQADQLWTAEAIYNISNIELKFTNPTYNSARKFSYDITGFFSGESNYTKTLPSHS